MYELEIYHRANGDEGADGEDVYPQGKGLCGDFFFGRTIVRLFGRADGGGRGGIPARGAAAGKGVFFPGKAAGGTAYRREKPAAVRTGFGIPFNFLIAVIAEKTGFFTQNYSLGGLSGRFVCGGL